MIIMEKLLKDWELITASFFFYGSPSLYVILYVSRVKNVMLEYHEEDVILITVMYFLSSLVFTYFYVTIYHM